MMVSIYYVIGKLIGTIDLLSMENVAIKAETLIKLLNSAVDDLYEIAKEDENNATTIE